MKTNIKLRPLRWLIQAGYLVVVLVGLKLGFDIGVQMSGPMLGAVMAVNSAVFGVLLFSVVAGWIERLAGPGDRQA